MRRDGEGAVAHRPIELSPWNRRVDQPPSHRRRRLDALAFGDEDIGEIPADVPLVAEAGEPAGRGEHREEWQLGERHGRRSVVDEQDLIAGEGKLISAPGRGTVDGRDVGLPGVGGGVFDLQPRLVRELAEIHLPRMGGLSEHPDVRAGREAPVLGGGDDHAPDRRMLES